MNGDLHDEYYVRIFRRRDADPDGYRRDTGSDDYHDFLRFVFSEYLEPVLRTESARVAVDRWQEGRERFYSIARYIREQERLVRTNNFARAYVDRFALVNDVADARPALTQALNILDQLFAETQLADILEDYFDAIIAGMSVSDLPEADAQALKQCGSRDPGGDLAASIVLLKAQRERIRRGESGKSFAQRVHDIPESIDKAREQAMSRDAGSQSSASPAVASTESGRPIRRLYKGLGQVFSGLATFGTNLVVPVAAFSGVVHGVQSLELAVLAASTMCSLGNGLGQMLMGKGDFDGE